VCTFQQYSVSTGDFFRVPSLRPRSNSVSLECIAFAQVPAEESFLVQARPFARVLREFYLVLNLVDSDELRRDPRPFVRVFQRVFVRDCSVLTRCQRE